MRILPVPQNGTGSIFVKIISRNKNVHSNCGQDDADDGAFEPDDDHVLYGQGDLGGQDHGDGGGEHDDLRDADDGDEDEKKSSLTILT